MVRISHAICIKVEECIAVSLIDDLLYVNLVGVDLVCHKLCQRSLVHLSKFLPEQIMSSICSWSINMNSSDEECILFQCQYFVCFFFQTFFWCVVEHSIQCKNRPNIGMGFLLYNCFCALVDYRIAVGFLLRPEDQKAQSNQTLVM